MTEQTLRARLEAKIEKYRERAQDYTTMRAVIYLGISDELAALLLSTPAEEPQLVTSGDVIEAAYRLEKELCALLPTFPRTSYVRDVLEKHLRAAFLRSQESTPAPTQGEKTAEGGEQ